MLQKPPKNETSFLYKALMPDYRKSKLVSMRKRNDQEGMQVRSIPSGNVAEQNEEHRRAKGRNDAQQTITEIYDTKLFQMLNESAKGLAGSRGHRIAENNLMEKQKIVVKALLDFRNENKTKTNG